MTNELSLQLAISAHQHTSHVPEKRGRQEVERFKNLLEEDKKSLKALVEENEFENVWEIYSSKLCQKYSAYLSARSRCASTMITGGSNFNVKRNEKANRSSDNRYEEFSQFRERFFKKCRPSTQIKSGDSDAVEKLKSELEILEKNQAKMKAINKIVRKHKKDLSKAIPEIVDQGFTEEQAKKLIEPDFAGRSGFAGFQLTNNNAKIKRVKGRLEKVSAAKETPVSELEIGDITVEDNPPENRYRIYFPGKPEAEIIKGLKAHGFRWAPSIQAWSAYRNSKARNFIEILKKDLIQTS